MPLESDCLRSNGPQSPAPSACATAPATNYLISESSQSTEDNHAMACVSNAEAVHQGTEPTEASKGDLTNQKNSPDCVPTTRAVSHTNCEEVVPMYGVDMKLSQGQVKELVSIVGNHAMPEHEWVRACHLLGDYDHTPKPSALRRTLPLAIGALVVLGAAIPWYHHYTNSFSDDSLVPPPPPAVVASDLRPYLTSMISDVKSRYRPPASLPPARVVVDYKVDRSGEVQDLRILTTSGYEAADQAAIEAVESAAPFPPLPPGTRDLLEIQFGLGKSSRK